MRMSSDFKHVMGVFLSVDVYYPPTFELV